MLTVDHYEGHGMASLAMRRTTVTMESGLMEIESIPASIRNAAKSG